MGQSTPAPRDAATPGRFEIQLVDPEGKPVPHAGVMMRMAPVPTAKDTELGKFLSNGEYGARFESDDDGRVAIRLAPSRLAVFIEHPGFGPYWADWDSDSHRNVIPEVFTSQLERAWSVGSLIVDE